MSSFSLFFLLKPILYDFEVQLHFGNYELPLEFR